MAVVTAKGPDSFKLLQFCISKDLKACVGKARAPLSPGRCAYGVFLNESGRVIDDAIVYMTEVNHNMIVEDICPDRTARRPLKKMMTDRLDTSG